MSETDFLPRRERELARFVANFAARIEENPQSFGLHEQDAQAYRLAADSYCTAHTIANTPGTRTTPAVAAKNTALKIIRKMTRSYAKRIHAAHGVTVEAKCSLGLTIRRPGGRVTRILRPASAPLLRIARIDSNGLVTVRLKDRHSTRKGRPEGVVGGVLYGYICAGEPPRDISEWTVISHFSRPKVVIAMPDVPAGQKLWVAAQWMNPRLERGPVCDPVRIGLGPTLIPAGAKRIARIATATPQQNEQVQQNLRLAA